MKSVKKNKCKKLVTGRIVKLLDDDSSGARTCFNPRVCSRMAYVSGKWNDYWMGFNYVYMDARMLSGWSTFTPSFADFSSIWVLSGHTYEEILLIAEQVMEKPMPYAVLGARHFNVGGLKWQELNEWLNMNRGFRERFGGVCLPVFGGCASACIGTPRPHLDRVRCRSPTCCVSS